MAKIFLDTNILIDLLSNRSDLDLKTFDNHDLYLSVLSIHISAYLLKIKVPNKTLESVIDTCEIIDLTAKIYQLSSHGPNEDLEDNIQLHSCAQANCDYFLTNDKKLLKMIYFGKTKIIKELPKETDIMDVYASVKIKKSHSSLQYDSNQGKKIKAKKTASQQYTAKDKT